MARYALWDAARVCRGSPGGILRHFTIVATYVCADPFQEAPE